MERNEVIRSFRHTLAALGRNRNSPRDVLLGWNVDEAEAKARGALIALVNHIEEIRAGKCHKNLDELMDQDGFNYDTKTSQYGTWLHVGSALNWQEVTGKALAVLNALAETGIQPSSGRMDIRLGDGEADYFKAAADTGLRSPPTYPQVLDFMRILATHHGYPNFIASDESPLPLFAPIVMNPYAQSPALPIAPIAPATPPTPVTPAQAGAFSGTEEPPAQPKIQKRQKPSREEQLEAQRVASEKREKERTARKEKQLDALAERKKAKEVQVPAVVNPVTVEQEPEAALPTEEATAEEEKQRAREPKPSKPRHLNGILHALRQMQQPAAEEIVRAVEALTSHLDDVRTKQAIMAAGYDDTQQEQLLQKTALQRKLEAALLSEETIRKAALAANLPLEKDKKGKIAPRKPAAPSASPEENRRTLERQDIKAFLQALPSDSGVERLVDAATAKNITTEKGGL